MKIRCSQISKLMATPRTKGESLSQTAKTYIQELVLEHKYGIKKEFWSRYTDKGNQVEDDAISFVNDVLDLGFIYKNEERFENDFISGVPDVNTNEILTIKQTQDCDDYLEKIYEANTFEDAYVQEYNDEGTWWFI